jgi:excinuclease ABC subunit A
VPQPLKIPRPCRPYHDNLRQRLAESFEAALRAGQRARHCHGDGYANHSEFDSALHNIGEGFKAKEHLFNAKFACPVCSHSIHRAGTAPVLVQLAGGRLPGCDGLGQQDFFDPTRVVAFPSLSLASGAIKGWDRRNGYYFSMLESLAKHYQV